MCVPKCKDNQFARIFAKYLKQNVRRSFVRPDEMKQKSGSLPDNFYDKDDQSRQS